MGEEGEDRQLLKSIAVFSHVASTRAQTDNVHREGHKHLHFTLRQLWGEGGRETGDEMLGWMALVRGGGHRTCAVGARLTVDHGALW